MNVAIKSAMSSGASSEEVVPYARKTLDRRVGKESRGKQRQKMFCVQRAVRIAPNAERRFGADGTLSRGVGRCELMLPGSEAPRPPDRTKTFRGRRERRCVSAQPLLRDDGVVLKPVELECARGY